MRMGTEPSATPQRMGLPFSTALFVAIAGTVVVAQSMNQSSYPFAPWLSGLAFGSFALALHHRSLVLVPIVLTELTLYSYAPSTLGMAQRFAVMGIALLLSAGMIFRADSVGDTQLRRVVIPAIAFILVATIVNSMFSVDEYVFKYLRYQIAQVMLLVLVATLIRSRHDLKQICVAALVIGVVAGIATIWQHYAPSSAPYGAETAETVRQWKGRAIGFANTPIGISDQMTFVLAPLIGALLCGPWRLDRLRICLGLALLIMIAALNFTYTRSALFALGPGVMAMGVMLRSYRRWLVVGAMAVAVLIFPMLENTGLIGDRYYRDTSNDQSARSHEALFQVSLAIALDHPLVGIGHEHFEDVVLDYMDDVTIADENVSAADAEGQRPHNDWLSVWLSWGIFALIAYIAIFLGALMNLIRVTRHSDWLIRGLGVGCIGGLVVYGVNSAYHNLLDSSVFLFLYAGLSVALARIASDASNGNLVARLRSVNMLGRK